LGADHDRYKIDLTTGQGNMIAAVRLNANLDESRVKYGSASGYVSGATTYGNSVMALANQIQTTEIDPLAGL
jgi:hypothetical protein